MCPLRALTEYTLPAWSPKYTFLSHTIGEDSVPALIGIDQTMCPVRIDSATNRPLPGLEPYVESTGTYSRPSRTPIAGEAAARFPTCVSHSCFPVSASMPLTQPPSFMRYSVVR